MLPMSLTVSVTYNCNSRCKTCKIYERQTEVMSVAQYEKIFSTLAHSPRWVTISGGEPFLREDLPGICAAIHNQCRPAVINIPTNGLLHRKIPSAVEAITASCAGAKIIVNLSVDGVGNEHDEIRGVPGNYEKAIKTYRGLKELQRSGARNLSLGIHTVISRFNVETITDIVPALLALEPDSYITEIAENRVELKTMNLDITPTAEEYEAAIDFVMNRISRRGFTGVGRIIQSFRLEYYEHVKSLLFGKPARWPCYAGFASAQIMPDGEVWQCCIKGESMGNLQKADYDFQRVWFSEQAEQVRQTIKGSNCQCPLANAAYTNMLLHPPTLMRVALRALLMKNKRNLARMSHKSPSRDRGEGCACPPCESARKDAHIRGRSRRLVKYPG
jgi:MoaA/NifB/PqqE/SkfB family radical SAM enzyme